VWQQIRGEVIILIQTSFTDGPLMNLTVKKYDNWSTFAKVMVTIKVTYF